MRRHGLFSRPMSHEEDLWQCWFPRRLRQCGVIMIKRNDTLMVRDVGIQSHQCWWESLHMEEREISMTKRGYKWFLKAAQRKESNTAENAILCYLRAIQERHFGVIPVEPEFMDYVFIPYKWKKYVCHGGHSWNFQSTLGNGLIPGGNEEDEGRQAVFLTPTHPFWNDAEEETPHDDFSIPQKAPLRNSIEKQPRCCILGTIAKISGSRIGILANEIICNHDLHYTTGGCIEHAWLKGQHGSIFASHLCVQKSLVIWCVTCLILGCSLTRFPPWALPLHLSTRSHNKNT